MKKITIVSLQRLIMLLSIACFAGILILFNATSPDNSSPVLLMVIFILMYGVVFGAINASVIFFSNFKKLAFPDAISKKRTSLGRRYGYILIASCVPVFVLAVSSIRPIGGFELLLVILLASLACFLVYKK